MPQGVWSGVQFNSASLNRHLTNAYNANVGTFTSRGFVEVLAATQTTKKQTWFQGMLSPSARAGMRPAWWSLPQQDYSLERSKY